jgi:hypothetical protein
MRESCQLALRRQPASSVLAAALLGADHPFVEASVLLQRIARQSLAVASVLLGAIAASIAGYAWAWTLMLGAGWVLLILLLLAAGFHHCTRDHAIDLILQGCQNFPIAAIEHQRRRLRSARTRSRLARSVMLAAEGVSRGPEWPDVGRPAKLHHQTIEDAVDDLLEVAQALATEEVSVQGVARAERLIIDGASPFYGDDMIALRAELRRIRHDLLPS